MNQSPNTSVINLPGVQWWLKKRRTYLMRNFLMIFIILGIMGFAFSQLNLRELETPELIFLIAFGGFLLLIALGQLKKWAQSKHIQITNYWYGVITDTRSEYNRRKKSRRYYITADVNGKTMEGICLTQTFNRAQIGQQVLLFTLSGERVYCVHPDM